jgi:transposase
VNVSSSDVSLRKVLKANNVVLSKTKRARRNARGDNSLAPRDMDGDGTRICPRKKRFGRCPMMNRCARIVVFHWNLRAAKDWPSEEKWAFEWIENIGQLYALNEARLRVLDVPGAFDKAHARLSGAIDNMAQERDSQLKDPKLYIACRKALQSLERHWSGLTLFVGYPEVPMDNNYGERQLRNPVVGRKNYYGSGSFWSAALTVMAFSLFQTLKIWNINPRIWLTAYLEVCAGNGCRPPADAECFLPWNMDRESLCLFTNPKPATNNTS